MSVQVYCNSSFSYASLLKAAYSATITNAVNATTFARKKHCTLALVGLVFDMNPIVMSGLPLLVNYFL